MAHCTKFNKGAMGHMLAHYDRTAKNISNENIDYSRTHENYNLAPNREKGKYAYIQERLENVKVLNRDDVNIMADWVVTYPKTADREHERAFFEHTYEFLKNRYGGEKNVISAYVHKDEVSPHLHFAFIPICENKKKGGEKLSAKEVVNRKDLQTFHNDLQEYLYEKIGIEFDILNEATKEGNKAIAELKKTSAIKEMAVVNDLKAQQQEIEQRVKSYEPPKKTIIDKIPFFKGNYEQKVQAHEQVALTYNREKDLDKREKDLNEWQDELDENQKRLDKGLSSYKIQVNQANEQISQAWNEIERAIEKGVTAELQRQQRLQNATAELHSFKEKLERIGIKERNVFNDNKLHQNERNDTQQSQTQTSRHNNKLHKRHTIER